VPQQTLDLGPDEPLHVAVPPVIADAVAAVSPRLRVHPFSPQDGVPTGEAAQSQVWVPPSGYPTVPDDVVRALPRLRLVQLLTAGAERFIGRLPEGVVLCNARGAHTPATAEWAMAATLSAQRGIPFFTREQDAQRWSFRRQHTLFGARVLVVGAGDIGRAIGRMLDGFGVEVDFVARSARDGVHATSELPQLLPRADVVVLVVPVTTETTRMVDAAFLAAMKDDALLVNAARGVVVDTDALLAELTSGRLRAALDVTDPEPLPPGHPLWSAPGLLLTPHVGGEIPGTVERGAASVVSQLRRVLAGEPLADVVGDY
jgi:phosphoglycerate dehydrogenase-like enzyme